MKPFNPLTRRQFIATGAAIASSLAMPGVAFASTSTSTLIQKAIPKSGEDLPVIGMGTSRTFEGSNDPQLINTLKQVTQAFFDLGGGMIDSSPMYGSAQQFLGQILPQIKNKNSLFAATKVWTNGRQSGIEQMEQSRQLWGIERFDLMQIHNLVDWETHLQTLQQMKAEGGIRYIGITTSHGRYHDDLQSILRKHKFDFLQLSYNIADREVEQSLLSIAQDKGIAVIANRPYQRGSLFRKVKGMTLPDFAQEFDCSSWGQFFLKFVVSHPAVNCAIPATSKVHHMQDNMQAGRGRLPDARQRQQMIRYFESL
jgi:diketogulonate reductase-like aldo/keto reductase